MSRLISQEKHFAELDFDDKTASSCLANNLEKHIKYKDIQTLNSYYHDITHPIGAIHDTALDRFGLVPDSLRVASRMQRRCRL